MDAQSAVNFWREASKTQVCFLFGIVCSSRCLHGDMQPPASGHFPISEQFDEVLRVSAYGRFDCIIISATPQTFLMQQCILIFISESIRIFIVVYLSIGSFIRSQDNSIINPEHTTVYEVSFYVQCTIHTILHIVPHQCCQYYTSDFTCEY